MQGNIPKYQKRRANELETGTKNHLKAENGYTLDQRAGGNNEPSKKRPQNRGKNVKPQKFEGEKKPIP